jgi:hypothetical protein
MAQAWKGDVSGAYPQSQSGSLGEDASRVISAWLGLLSYSTETAGSGN